jgi:hypothetical protein
MSTIAPDIDAEPVAPPDSSELPPPPDPGWSTDKNGKEYITKPAGRGKIYRQPGETVEQALERDLTRRRDDAPRRKPRTPQMPKAPRKVDLKELEETLAEALKSPGALAAAFGDDWAASHFAGSGKYLARNLVLASEHNPWLRTKLEEAATGQDATMKLVSLIGVGGAFVMYIVPPVIWYLNLPVPEQTRSMFGIPPRRERSAEYAAGPVHPDEPVGGFNGAAATFEAG